MGCGPLCSATDHTSTASAREAKWLLRNRANNHTIIFAPKCIHQRARDALDTHVHICAFRDDDLVESIIRDRKRQLKYLGSITYEGFLVEAALMGSAHGGSPGPSHCCATAIRCVCPGVLETVTEQGSSGGHQISPWLLLHHIPMTACPELLQCPEALPEWRQDVHVAVG